MKGRKQAAGRPQATRIGMTASGQEGLARQLPGATHPRHVVMAAVALGAAAHLARDRRNLQHIIMIMIVLAAAESFARASQKRSLERLADWDQRQSARERRPRRIRTA
jgi:hypothetical protein